jgi:hypothetical protein
MVSGRFREASDHGQHGFGHGVCSGDNDRVRFLELYQVLRERQSVPPGATRIRDGNNFFDMRRSFQNRSRKVKVFCWNYEWLQGKPFYGAEFP